MQRRGHTWGGDMEGFKEHTNSRREQLSWLSDLSYCQCAGTLSSTYRPTAEAVEAICDLVRQPLNDLPVRMVVLAWLRKRQKGCEDAHTSKGGAHIHSAPTQVRPMQIQKSKCWSIISKWPVKTQNNTHTLYGAFRGRFPQSLEL